MIPLNPKHDSSEVTTWGHSNLPNIINVSLLLVIFPITISICLGNVKSRNQSYWSTCKVYVRPAILPQNMASYGFPWKLLGLMVHQPDY